MTYGSRRHQMMIIYATLAVIVWRQSYAVIRHCEHCLVITFDGVVGAGYTARCCYWRLTDAVYAVGEMSSFAIIRHTAREERIRVTRR